MKAIDPISGSEIPLESINHRDLGYGQSVEPLETFVITFWLTASEVSELLQEEYSRFVAETREEEFESWDLLHGAGYPPFSSVVANFALFNYVILNCLHFQLLERIACGKGGKVQVNEILGAERIGDDVLITCRAFAFGSTPGDSRGT